MELQEVVERYARAIEHVDAHVAGSGVNTRTGMIYRSGFKSLNEEPAVDAIDDAWQQLHPKERRVHMMKVRYPELAATAKIDHVFSTDSGQDADEWGLEVKRLQFVGDNGKRNDYATTKMLSPYLKDRGLLHDALRLREYGFTRRVAVLGYSFDYDTSTLREAKKMHGSTAEGRAVIAEIAKVLEGNGGHLRTRPLIEFADAIMSLRGLTRGPRAEATFDAWRHPAGGRGVVFGWEIRRPQLEPDYDPRHPW